MQRPTHDRDACSYVRNSGVLRETSLWNVARRKVNTAFGPTDLFLVKTVMVEVFWVFSYQGHSQVYQDEDPGFEHSRSAISKESVRLE